jgi:hypothetical protein
VAKATKNKKSKEGRHVGLDFIDLLIEALKNPGWLAGAQKHNLAASEIPRYEGKLTLITSGATIP